MLSAPVALLYHTLLAVLFEMFNVILLVVYVVLSGEVKLIRGAIVSIKKSNPFL